MIEYATTCRQWVFDDHAAPAPVPPPGDGWKLAHFAAASGRGGVPKSQQLGPAWPVRALLFFVWERITP